MLLRHRDRLYLYIICQDIHPNETQHLGSCPNMQKVQIFTLQKGIAVTYFLTEARLIIRNCTLMIDGP